ncbi:MAG: peptidylprolyl isomerase [Hyphomonadaceae bacterium]|nr:peptidylprolyl isomerase [Hyphomonadaceae bacterium]
MGLTLRYWRPLAICLAVVGFIAVTGLSACGDRTPTARPGDGGSAADPIVAATVNGKPIYISDVEAEATVRGIIREGEELDAGADEFFQVLEDLIETRLFAMEAEKRQIDRNADVRHRLERARELILAGALNDQIRDTALDESAVERMYREQVRLLRNGREVHVRQIVLGGKEAAAAAKRRLDAGEAFEALAYELSLDRSTATEGGDMGFQLPESLPDGLREAAGATPVGQIAGPIQTTQGWHIIKIEERREEAPPSIESLRPRIEQWLMFEETRRIVEKLKAQSRIERFMEEGRVAAGQGGTAPAAATRPDTRRRDGQAPMGPGGVAAAAGQEAPPVAAPPAVGAPKAGAPKTGVAGLPKAPPRPASPEPEGPSPQNAPLAGPPPPPGPGERET